MEFILICLCPLLCLLLPIKVRKNGLFSLITVLATAVVVAIELIAAFTSSDFHMLAFAFQLFIPAQLISLVIVLVIGNLVIDSINKRTAKTDDTPNV